ncbi:radical SAM/SPASM domain-containing protein [Humidesulfovibrio idahonensis]
MEDPRKELVERADFRGHLSPHFKIDPNTVIHAEYLRLHGPAMAERFLAYRRTFESVNRERSVAPFPLTVNVGLRDACNQRCPHCYRQYDPDPHTGTRLSKTAAFGLIDQCAALGTPAMLFGTASEHFTHPDAMEILQYACSKPELLDIFLATNAQLLDEEKIDALLAMRLSRVTVSIDAITPETYAKVRGGDYPRLVRNLQYLLRRRKELGQKLPILRVTFVDYNLNHHENEAFWRYWVDQADIVDIQKFMDVRRIDDLQDCEMKTLNCAYPWNMLYVRWDGEVFPCCSEFCKHIPVGNLNERTLGEIWNGPQLAELRRRMTTYGEFPKTCVNCLSSLGSETPVNGLG